MAKYSSMETSKWKDVTVIGDYCTFAVGIEVTEKGKLIFRKLKGGDEIEYIKWKGIVENILKQHCNALHGEEILFIANEMNLDLDTHANYMTFFSEKDNHATAFYVDSHGKSVSVDRDEITDLTTGKNYIILRIGTDCDTCDDDCCDKCESCCDKGAIEYSIVYRAY